ncbi:T-cell surface glycoprotein CD1b-like, partial [Saccopteryx leptura]|uniref:T-cell surface glycoprotein CD1b-like n=1 Tax=Saccopteryx leptura TaxID=249018 RepID=UPI00339C4661
MSVCGKVSDRRLQKGLEKKLIYESAGTHPAEGFLPNRVPMLLLLPLLFKGILWHGPTLHGPTSFHVNQISSFVNNTCAQNQGSGWLDDLQIHGWDSDKGTAIFLKPWSKGIFSDAEMTEVVETSRVYFIGFTQIVQNRVSEFELT